MNLAASLSTAERDSVRWRPLVLLLGVAVLLRVIALLVFEGDVHDGLTRVGTAAAWLDGQREVFGRTVWPEGNYLLPAGILAVWPDLYWAPRVLYAFVGVLNVASVYAVGRRVVGHEGGLAAGWVVALMPFHITVSANAAMSEGPYIAFIMLAILGAVHYADRPSAAVAAAAGLALTCATSFRIDGVVWGIPLAASFAYSAWRNGAPPLTALRDLVLFGACGLLYPVSLVLAWWTLYPSDPWHLLAEAKLNTQQFFVDGRHPRWPHTFYQTYALAFWPASLFVLLTPLVAMVSLVGAWRMIRRRTAQAFPLVFGLAAVGAWLGYATFSHDILAQWRYSLVLAVVLAVFFWPGVLAVSEYVSAASTTRVITACAIVALTTQTLISFAAFRDLGVLTRQLTVISPLRPAQFSGREFLEWAASANGRVLATPHVLEQPYVAMRRGDLEQSGRFVAQSYYLPGSQLVHTSESLKAELSSKLKDVQYVATSAGTRELGLRDGAAVREIVLPDCSSRQRCTWEGVSLEPARVFGNIIVWRVTSGE